MNDHRDFIVGTIMVIGLIITVLNWISGAPSSCGVEVDRRDCAEQLVRGQ